MSNILLPIFGVVIACTPALPSQDAYEVAEYGTKLAECQQAGRAADAGHIAAYNKCLVEAGIKEGGQ